MLIKSKDALAWLRSARPQVPVIARQGVGDADHPLTITFWVRYASRRPDLSIELLLDLLEDAGVIANDRYVFEFHAYKEIVPDNPGVDILIEEASA